MNFEDQEWVDFTRTCPSGLKTLLLFLVDNTTTDISFDYFAREVYEIIYYYPIRDKLQQKKKEHYFWGDYYTYQLDYNVNMKLSVSAMKAIQKYLIPNLETPIELFFRVSKHLWKNSPVDFSNMFEDLMKLNYIHGSPTLFNAGLKKNQLISCFLTKIQEDSMESIMETVKRCALISANGAGVGVAIHGIRPKNAPIVKSNGLSDGIIPMLKLFEQTSKYCNQAGKRDGAFSIYLEPSHLEIFEFCEMKKHTGQDSQRAIDLFYALWIPDEFMLRVIENKAWTLMYVPESVGINLYELYGDEYTRAYRDLESGNHSNVIKRSVSARVLWMHIVLCILETGNPFILFKDACNAKSNHKHYGTITSSNLCTEIIQFSPPNSASLCNIGTISLPAFYKNNTFEINMFDQAVRNMVRNLNQVIDVGYYANSTIEDFNKKVRPIGLGLQGLQNIFFEMMLPYTSTDAQYFNIKIFERLYYIALSESVNLAIERNQTFYEFEKSDFAKGILQFDYWPKKFFDQCLETNKNINFFPECDWKNLSQRIKEHGTLNSLLTTVPPTATTSTILGNIQSIEPEESFAIRVNTKDGRTCQVTKELQSILKKNNLWDDNMLKEIIANNGSIANISRIPENIRLVFKTAYELDIFLYNKMVTDRCIFLDHSQSKTLFFNQSTNNASEENMKVLSRQLSDILINSWKSGHKTGIYYSKTKQTLNAFNYSKFDLKKKENEKKESCENKMDCDQCSA